jgi:hypothetical protein
MQPILAQKERLERLLTLRFDADEAARIAAMESFAGTWASICARR